MANLNLFINETILEIRRIKGKYKRKKKCENNFLFTIGLPYFGKISHQFSKRLEVLIKKKFNISINVYYTTLQNGSYFQLKCFTSMHLISNVVY